jgi:hypothetical protein
MGSAHGVPRSAFYHLRLPLVLHECVIGSDEHHLGV